MHRILLVALFDEAEEKFMVVGDSEDASITADNPVSIGRLEGGGTWAERHNIVGYEAPAATLDIGGHGVVSGLSYWRVAKTGRVLPYDFAKAGLSERKVITSGRLVCEYQGRTYTADPGDSIMFLTDPADVDPFLVRFYGNDDCTVVYTDFAVAEPALSATGELARTQLGLI